MNRERAFRDRLVQAIDEGPYKKGELAKRLGVRAATVSAWVAEKDFSLPEGAQLLQLPALLNVRADWLVLGEKPMRPVSPELEVAAFRRMAEIVDTARSPGATAGLLERADLAASGQPTAPLETTDPKTKEGRE